MARIEVQGNDLVIRLPLNVKPVQSGSGKSNIIDTTRGFVGHTTPFGDIKVGLNVITTDPNYAARVVPKAAPKVGTIVALPVPSKGPVTGSGK
jgi:hypothetical protein